MNFYAVNIMTGGLYWRDLQITILPVESVSALIYFCALSIFAFEGIWGVLGIKSKALIRNLSRQSL